MTERDQLTTILPLSRIEQPPTESRPRSSGIESRSADSLSALWPALIQALPVPFVVVDEKWRIALANGAARELLGDPSSPFVGFSAARLLSLECLEEARSILLQRAGRHHYTDTLQLEAGEIDVAIDAELLVVEGRELLCLALTDKMASQREQAEFEHVDEWGDEPRTVEASHSLAPERLQQAHRFETLGHLTGSLAHEFNNLLSVIMGSLELAERALRRDESPRADVERAMLAAERSTETINHVLRYTRRNHTEQEPLLPVEILEELRGLIERTVRKSTQVTIDAEQTGRVMATIAQLETALLNLVINARDAMAETSRDGDLFIGCAEVWVDAGQAQSLGITEGSYVQISVSDNGVGVSPETRPHVFAPFYTTKPDGVGTGLGLSTVRTFCRKAGGTTVLESTHGVGTTVRMLLPVIDGPLSVRG